MDEPDSDDASLWQRYDRAGTPISAERFVELARQPGYRFIRRTSLLDAADPHRTFRITTVWIGAVARTPGDGPPQIFETMVFGPDHHPFRPLHGRKYGTEPDAMIGHHEAAGKLATQLIDPVRVDLD
ncbi:hypothetical protein IQ251_18575 [Saccharopolyspora sp. HNM0983]|uniref:Uncharacterized protein n=1 Tax=Saccharopolyspora montiporae TaxID=2781240 RepID=A0A929BAU2_9PSEU|nr:hypothetical protein [Saccharopolyspora sp. HNM0983]MBE9376459.1 hypothetical protein [Saccharopolyspora sp. HNM0983]